MSAPDIVKRLRSRAWEDRQHRKLREEAAAEIERLRRERDDITLDFSECCQERSYLLAQVAALREALEPFARYETADGIEGSCLDTLRMPDSHPILFNGIGNDCRAVVTIGDFRRARALSDAKEQADG